MASVSELREKLEALGIDPDKIQGSGVGGNVLKSDLEAALARAERKQNSEGLDSGPKRGSSGEYLPARYRVKSGAIREDH